MIRAYFHMLLIEAEATNDLPHNARPPDPAGKMKQFATWFTHGVAGGAKLRAAIYHAGTGAAVLAEVERFFAAQPAGNADELLAQDGGDEPGFPEAEVVCG